VASSLFLIPVLLVVPKNTMLREPRYAKGLSIVLLNAAVKPNRRRSKLSPGWTTARRMIALSRAEADQQDESKGIAPCPES